MSRKLLPCFRDLSNASDAMLKIRVRLAYPSCGSPKHRCWRDIHHQTRRNLAWSSNLEKLSVARKDPKHQLKQQLSGIQPSTRTLRRRGAFIIIILPTSL